RQMIAHVLVEKYQDLLDSGWGLTKAEIQRDVAALFGGNFHQFVDG
ncbi:glucuronate isomerase, partial [Candidatus Poribacteria bacterium]|nr:glucuronate isomerase [Candidatus Poribacteria bacterium]